MSAALRARFPFKAPSNTVDHLVIGGGVVGLAVAARLTQKLSNKSTYVIERHKQIGQESSSRNSEVIHAGIYYPPGSLKAELCIRGRQMMYERCEKLSIPHRKTQKLVIATGNHQVEYLDRLHMHTQHPSFADQVPTYFLGGDEARGLEPDLAPWVKAAMISTETGIVDSHALMESLEREIEEEGGEGLIVRGTRVVRVDPDPKGEGWVVQMETGWTKEDGHQGETEAVLAKVVVNAAGLGAAHIVNPLLPENERTRMYLSKGSYMSYKGPGVENVSRLLYPCPEPGLAGLGTHLTIDLAGNIKFGPDVEYIGTPEEADADPDYWQKHLAVDDSEEKRAEMAEAIQRYLPGIDASRLEPDYCGIRANILPPSAKFSDFVIQHSPERIGLISLLGFNSPGLTSSLAVAELVEKTVRRGIWKGGDRNVDGWA